ncbi:MAG: hypothetical protein HQL48_04780 [Gammaproteobacteria bacterium]|nr:hypothetical protein [Gammaproteobacteria bacterium]
MPVNDAIYLVAAHLRDLNLQKLNSLLKPEEHFTSEDFDEFPLFPYWKHARKAVEEDEYGAGVWFEHSKDEFAEASRTIQRLTWELTHAKTLVAILEDPSVPDGSVISIPPSHDVDPAIRALEARKAKTQCRETDEIPSDSVLALIGVARVED